jgi:acyl-CoA synthetase (AMP-forming)/AMP-acid ligase II
MFVLTVPDCLKRAADEAPHRIATIDRGHGGFKTTFLELDRKSNKFANGLIELGIKKGDKVAVLGFNSTSWMIAHYGISKAGAILVPVNYRLVGRELEYIFDHSDSKIVVVEEKLLPTISDSAVIKDKGIKVIVMEGKAAEGMYSFDDIVGGASAKDPGVDVGELDTHSIFYTSGTTGRPKGAVKLHAGTKYMAVTVANVLDYRGGTIYTSDYPFFSCGGIWFSNAGSVLAAQTQIINPVFDPKQTMKTIEEEGVNIYFCVPAMLFFLINLPDFKEYDISSLRSLACGGGPLPFAVLKQAKELFKGVEMCNIYGFTEGGGMSLVDKYIYEKPGSVGHLRGLSGEFMIVDDNDNPVKPGEIGECVCRGPDIMKEYYKNPDETAKASKGGWFHTGDIGKADEDGFVWLVDRKKDMIIRGGYNIYPAEVEEVLYSHPNVLEAAVIGIPHKALGQDIKAFIILREGKAENKEDIINYCKKNLADYKVPRHVEFATELPRNPAGKVLKWMLRDQEQKKAETG